MIILTDKMLVIPVGISPNYAGAGKSDIKIQDSKDVTITENGSTTVVPDENFDVFTKVNITTDVNPALENKSVEITENGDYSYTASAPYYGIGNFNVKVNVEGHYESEKTVNPSFVEDVTVTPSEGFDAMSSVIVKKAEINLQDKNVPKASESQIVLTADEGYQGLGTVTIAPIKTGVVTVNPTSRQQIFAADPNNNYYFRGVMANGVPEKTLTADPSTNEQTFNSNHLLGEFYSKVVVNPVTSSIDSNIVPNNIAKGVSILGVEGTVEKFQIENSKTVNPSFVEDVAVTPSEGFDAISSVIVKKAVANLQDKNVDKASTSEIVLTADEGYQGLGTVTIAPINATAHTVNPSSQQQLITADTNNNEYIREVIVNGVPQKTLTADPSTNEQTFNSNHSSGEFYSKVVVNPVTSSIDSNIVPENIAKGVSILGVTGNLEAGSTPPSTTESYAIRQVYQEQGYTAYPINVRLTTDSWVSFDFAMSEMALSEYNMPILGVSDNSLRLYIEQRHLLLDIGDQQRVIDHTLDTVRHNISFGFVGDVNPDGFVHFKVEIDNVEMYNDYIAAPNFNLPLFLFGCPNEYHGTYEEYEILGGVTFLLNEVGITISSKYFYIFGLKVYNVNNSGERNLIRDYEPAIDADQKPCLLEKLSNEYEYPTLGTFMYVAVPAALPNEIANSDYGSELPQQCYIKPSAGAIVPTDIKLTPTTRIVMHVGDLGNFDEVSADATEEEILKSRVMVGAQPNLLISAYDENDVSRGLPGYEESHSISKDDLIWQITGGKGLYFGGCSNILYSTSDTDMNTTQYTLGYEKLCFGYDVVDEVPNSDSDSLNKILTTSYHNDTTSSFNKKAVTPTYSQFNTEMNTPICFFGNYNETTMKPDEVIALGYQEALSQIGYTTGIRYEIKRIEIYDRDSDGSISRKHMLVPATDVKGVNYLKDVVTGSSYYPYKGTLDVTSGTPIKDEPTIITDTFIKPSEGAIVPTDIKFTSLTTVTMHVKGFDNFEKITDIDSRAMIGAQPNFIISLLKLDGVKPNIDLYFKGCGNVLRSTEGGFAMSSNGEYYITVGYRPLDLNNFNIDTDTEMAKIINIGNRSTHKKVGPTTTPIYKFVDDQMTTPICIFGNYNNPSSMTPDDVIALGYENALSQIGYVTGVRYGVKQIDISVRNADGSKTITHSLVPARDKDGVICLYDTITKKSYYPYNGTLDVYNDPVEPEEPAPTILTDTYVKPSADAIVPTDIKFTSLTNVKMYVKDFNNVSLSATNMDSKAMIGAQPNFIVSPFVEDYGGEIGIYFNGGGSVLRSTDGKNPQTFKNNVAQLITVGYRPKDLNNINMDTDKTMFKIINFGSYTTNLIFKEIRPTSPTSNSIYKFVDDQMTTPICIFGNYNNPESMTPDDVIALGYENALSQIGYVTGARYGVRQVDITVYNTDGSMTTTHSLVPAKDTNNKVLLYDTITKKSYYPYNGTLDII